MYSFRLCRQAGLLRSFFRLALIAVILSPVCFPVAALELASAGTIRSQECDLISYSFPYKNGLYSTLAGFLNIPDLELKNQKTFKLEIEGFKNKLQVKAILQSNLAPLVVIIPGLDGKADGRLGKLWPSWYANAGYHVVWFDSTFLPSFVEPSGHGVTGNLSAESERVRDIIKTFINLNEVKGRISKLGIVGMSYGGIEALMLGQMAAEGRLPFAVDAIQAYSPPIDLRKTGELIDRWYLEDRWEYTLAELAGKLSCHKPVCSDYQVPFTDSFMRAGIAAAFRLGLADLVDRNDRVYKLGLLPGGNNFDDAYVRMDYAALWGYSKFMNELSYPYWQKKLKLNDLTELTAKIQLPGLLEKQPAYSETILAEDDPFNTPEDMENLKTLASSLPLTVLPRGGHLGFINESWTRAKLLTIFKSATTLPASPSHIEVRNQE